MTEEHNEYKHSNIILSSTIILLFFRSRKGERSLSIPKSTQEFKEIVYNKMMPESLTKPCVVRCKVIRRDNSIRKNWNNI